MPSSRTRCDRLVWTTKCNFYWIKSVKTARCEGWEPRSGSLVGSDGFPFLITIPSAISKQTYKKLTVRWQRRWESISEITGGQGWASWWRENLTGSSSQCPGHQGVWTGAPCPLLFRGLHYSFGRWLLFAFFLAPLLISSGAVLLLTKKYSLFETKCVQSLFQKGGLWRKGEWSE